MPRSALRIDPQDNIWTIDVAASQVVKFNPDGQHRPRARPQA
jgi:streptogramin lyase